MSELTDLQDALEAKKGVAYFAEFVALMDALVTRVDDVAENYAVLLTATSGTSMTLSVGTKTLNVGTGKGFALGRRVTAANAVDKLITGTVSDYDSGTGLLTFVVSKAADVTGSGDYSSWVITSVGDEGDAGANNVNWQGTYAGGSTYALNDGVYYNGSSFRSLQAGNIGHTPSAAIPPVDTSYWGVIAARGTDGAEYWNAPRVIANTDSPVTVADRDILLVRSGTGAITANAPASGRFKIVDVDGNAVTNNITVHPPTGDSLMDGATNENFIIDVNWFAAEFMRRPSGTNWSVA